MTQTPIIVTDPLHVVPTGDEIPHSLTLGCPCEPYIHSEGLVVHHSFDGYPDWDPTPENIQKMFAADAPDRTNH